MNGRNAKECRKALFGILRTYKHHVLPESYDQIVGKGDPGQLTRHNPIKAAYRMLKRGVPYAEVRTWFETQISAAPRRSIRTPFGPPAVTFTKWQKEQMKRARR